MLTFKLIEMKIIKNKYFAFLIIAAVLSSCDLKQQKSFEFKPETPVLQNFKDQTVWEWVLTNPGNEFNYLIQAVNLTGLQDEFSKNTDQHTFLLLKDLAFTGPGGVLQVITGSRTGKLETIDAARAQRLKNLLLYHIINEYVSQGPEKLKVLFQNYFFQTLLPGTNGQMSIFRDERFRLQFNRSDALPSSKRGTNGMLHNYVFKNGVAHLSTTYLRATPF